jgi:hypothetical protein
LFSGEDRYLEDDCFVWYSVQAQEEQPQRRQQQGEEKSSPYVKQILVIDDDPDITLTFKKGLEPENETSKGRIFFQVFTYNILY